ncbi:MAG: diguanylate cyclase [Treponema sp.]|jgi:diguanylate cyclase (GGDEF)-like protein|nr:diguanylate cyclase [Treponema sp.]
MQFTAALNSIFGSTLVVILIFADYARKYNTESYQRSLFLRLLAFTFAAMVMDFIFYLFNGSGGKPAAMLIHVNLAVYHVLLNLAFFHFFIFMDFAVFKDKKRVRIIYLTAWSVCALILTLVFANAHNGYYYYLDETNFLIRGKYHYVLIFAGFLPLLFAVYTLVSARRFLRKQQFLVTVIFVFFAGIGSAADRIFIFSSIIWPCLTAALLYAYFFVIQNDSGIDVLTGLGNRQRFDEFITGLEHPKRRKDPCSVVMIDMDHFKNINDTLGHSEGDNALRDMAGAVKDCIGRHDFAARYGGDEFILAVKEGEAGRLMERIQAALDRINAAKQRSCRLEISYGYDVYRPGSGMAIQDFLGHIDALMYKHKNERRRAEDQMGGSA